jgi:sulfate permease, SulP family
VEASSNMAERAGTECPGSGARRDVVGALTLAAMAFSQAFMSAQLARATPVAGIVTAVVGTTLYAALGPSRQISVGPAIAVCALIGATMAGVPREQLPQSLAALAVMVAGFLLIAARFELTLVQRLLPEPVLVGYLAGTALTVLVAQVVELASNGAMSLGVGLASLVLVLTLPRLGRNIPAAFAVIAFGTATSALVGLEGQGVRVLGSDVGRLGVPSLPTELDARALAALLVPAASIALFISIHARASIETFVRDGDPAILPRRVNFALAAANLVAGMCGGFAAGCSTSRAACPSQTGTHGRRAALMAAAALVLVSPGLMSSLHQLPQATLSGVLVGTAIGLIDVRRLRELCELNTLDFRLALVAAFAVAAVGPSWGVPIGIAAALFETLRRAACPDRQVLASGPDERHCRAFNPSRLPVVAGLLVYRFGAPLFFGNTDVFLSDMRRVAASPTRSLTTLIVDAETMGAPDAAARRALRTAAVVLSARGIRLTFANVPSAFRGAFADHGGIVMEHGEFVDAVCTIRMAARAAAARAAASQLRKRQRCRWVVGSWASRPRTARRSGAARV